MTNLICGKSAVGGNYNSTHDNVVKDKYILLPKINGKIALDFMNDFISAIIKLAIQDVVIYADKKIEATKQVIADEKHSDLWRNDI